MLESFQNMLRMHIGIPGHCGATTPQWPSFFVWPCAACRSPVSRSTVCLFYTPRCCCHRGRGSWAITAPSRRSGCRKCPLPTIFWPTFRPRIEKERTEAVEKTGPKSILLLSKHVPKVLKSRRQYRRPQLITRRLFFHSDPVLPMCCGSHCKVD